MAYVHGFTTADNIVKDLARALTTGDALVEENNWTLVYPNPNDMEGENAEERLEAALQSVTDKFTVKVQPKIIKQWIKKEPHTIDEDGIITVNNVMAAGGGTRIYVRDKKYYLYLKKGEGELDLMEYRIVDEETIQCNEALAGKQVLVDYEKEVEIITEYFVRIEKPTTTDSGKTNYYYFNWQIGENYDPNTDTFPADHVSRTGKVSWFKETSNAEQIAKGWLPIEYWISFDRNAGVGVVMGDPGLSASDWLSSPFYFGALRQIDGALETDLRGNFAGFGGSYTEPVLTKQYGDYTGTGITDVIMAATKTGRPYQAHKVAIFGGYEFREKTFNGQSAHTGKHPVSDIVLTDVHENDRGILYHCLAVPRVAKEHQTELIYNRYISGEEERYIFLNINAPFTPFNTSPDVLIGIAIRIDI